MTQKAKGVDYLHSLSHTKWNCRYHIVFAPKFRRKVFYEGRRLEIGKIISDLCKWKGVNLVEGEACPDHIHILVEIPPKMSVSGFMGFVKGKSSQMIYEKWGDAKFKFQLLSDLILFQLILDVLFDLLGVLADRVYIVATAPEFP